MKRGKRVVHGDKELVEKLGRNDRCPCGSGRRFQEVLYEVCALRAQETTTRRLVGHCRPGLVTLGLGIPAWMWWEKSNVFLAFSDATLAMTRFHPAIVDAILAVNLAIVLLLIRNWRYLRTLDVQVGA